MTDRTSKQQLMQLLRRAGLWEEADQYREQERQRLRAEGKNRQEAVAGAWQEMWDVYKPVVENIESQKQSDGLAPQLVGMPDRATNDILDPNYNEPDRGKQLRDGLLWAAMEFDRVIEDTNDGPVAHLNDASAPPPNAFGVGIMRTYALSPIERRRDLIGRALAFASKSHDNPLDIHDDDEDFLHLLK